MSVPALGRVDPDRVEGKVAAIILAAGGSARMKGRNKLLLPVKGLPMIATVTHVVLSEGYDPVCIITGYDESNVRQALGNQRVHLVHNKSWQAGMSGSLKLGLAALPQVVAGVLVVLGDMPLLSAPTLRALNKSFKQADGRMIVYPSYRGRQGNPVLFPRRYFGEMSTISGDRGCKVVLRNHVQESVAVPVESKDVIIDCDREEDYVRLLRRLEGKPVA